MDQGLFEIAAEHLGAKPECQTDHTWGNRCSPTQILHNRHVSKVRLGSIRQKSWHAAQTKLYKDSAASAHFQSSAGTTRISFSNDNILGIHPFEPIQRVSSSGKSITDVKSWIRVISTFGPCYMYPQGVQLNFSFSRLVREDLRHRRSVKLAHGVTVIARDSPLRHPKRSMRDAPCHAARRT